MKILVYHHPDGSIKAWDASNPQARKNAYSQMFDEISWVFQDMQNDPVVSALFMMAVNKNGDACEALVLYYHNRTDKKRVFDEVDVVLVPEKTFKTVDSPEAKILPATVGDPEENLGDIVQ